METFISSTQAMLNYEAAADVILAIIDDYNFRTDIRFDPLELKRKIVLAIQKNIEGNTTITKALAVAIEASKEFPDEIVDENKTFEFTETPTDIVKKAAEEYEKSQNKVYLTQNDDGSFSGKTS